MQRCAGLGQLGTRVFDSVGLIQHNPMPLDAATWREPVHGTPYSFLQPPAELKPQGLVGD